MLRFPVLVLLPFLLAFGSRATDAAGGPRARWRLEPYDFVHYEVRSAGVEDPATEERAADRAGHPTQLHGFYGYELEESLRPARPIGHAEWLYMPYAFRLPEARLDAKTQEEIDEVLPGNWRLGAVRARGRLGVRELGEQGGHPQVVLSGIVLLSPAIEEKPRSQAYYHLRDGRCTWTTTFDLERGLATKIEYELTARTGFANTPAPRAVNALRPGERTYRVRMVLDLDRRYEYRFSGFRGTVDRAILASMKHLLSRQGADGSFPGTGPLGTTGLALLALVRGGLATDHPDVARGFDWLLAQEPRGTYETGAAIMAVEALGTPPEELLRARRGEFDEPLPRVLGDAARAWLQRATDYLLENALAKVEDGRPVTGQESILRWGYPFDYEINLEPEFPDWWDNSNTQYAVLGLNAAARCGIEVPRTIWAGVARHYLSVQAPDGEERDALRLGPHRRPRDEDGRRYAPPATKAVERGWSYRECPRGCRTYGSMTTAGIASLVIAGAHLSEKRLARRHRLLSQTIDAAVRDGWAALDGMWTVTENPRYEGWFLYFLYGLERAGVLSDVETVGGHDWYWEGAMQLVLRQRDDGSWPAFHSDPHDSLWALLFLARSTTPITPR